MRITVFDTCSLEINHFYHLSISKNNYLPEGQNRAEDLKSLGLLEVVPGEAPDYEKVKEAIHGSEFVYSMIKMPIKESDSRTILENHCNIIKAMKACDIQKLVTFGMPKDGEKQQHMPEIVEYNMICKEDALQCVGNEIMTIGRWTKAFDLDWTFVNTA